MGRDADENDWIIERLSAQQCGASMLSVQAAMDVANLSRARRLRRCDDLVTKGLIARLFDCADDDAKKNTQKKLFRIFLCL